MKFDIIASWDYCKKKKWLNIRYNNILYFKLNCLEVAHIKIDHCCEVWSVKQNLLVTKYIIICIKTNDNVSHENKFWFVKNYK